jgi:hypothetical protein
MTNPMTTLGDTIYENSTPAPARLAGNTSTRRQYLSQTGTGSASAAPAWVNGPSYNVNDFGIFASGGGGTDLTSALSTMLSSVPDFATVYFPSSGSAYRIDGPLSISNRTLFFRGDGPNSTKLYMSNSTNAMFSVSSGVFGMAGFTFLTGSRTNGYPLISLTGVGNATTCSNYYDLWFDAVQGDAFYTTSGLGAPGNVSMHDCTLQSGSSGGKMFVSNGSQLAINNCNFRNSNNGSPCMWLKGATTTSSVITNNNFGGGGPLYSYSVSAASVSGSTMSITLPSTIGFNVEDYIVLQGFSTTAYNGFWRIASVSSSVVTATATPFYTMPSAGSASGTLGTAETVPACVVIDNINGPYDESVISNCIFSATGYPTDPLSASLYFQGTSSSASLEGWAVSNCFFDYGYVGVLITAQTNSNGTQRLNFSNCIATGFLANFFISKAAGIMINNCQTGDVTRVTATNFSCGLYVYSDSGQKSEGLQITGCNLGGTSIWNGYYYSSNTICTYGIVIDGQIQTFLMGNTICWGSTAPTYNLNSGLTSGTIVGGAGNLYLSGTTNPPTKNSTPTYFP